MKKVSNSELILGLKKAEAELRRLPKVEDYICQPIREFSLLHQGILDFEIKDVEEAFDGGFEELFVVKQQRQDWLAYIRWASNELTRRYYGKEVTRLQRQQAKQYIGAY
jgi:hypothetical protein